MDLYSQEIQEEEKRSAKTSPNNQKIAIGIYIYIINIYFKCKWIKYPNQKTRTG